MKNLLFQNGQTISRKFEIANLILLNGTLFCLLFGLSRLNYLLFHIIAEMISIVIACVVFVIAWNGSRFLKNQYLLIVGLAYLFIGGLDLLHTLSYKGMNVFPDYAYHANQLWIAARFMESITLLIGFWFLFRNVSLNKYLILGVYLFWFVLMVCSILIWKNFPECYIEGQGQTRFKIYAEYLICLIILASGLVLFKSRDRFAKDVFFLLLWSLMCSIVAELLFTFYISNFGISNLFGHFAKLISFGLIYKAIILTGFNEPYRLIFKELSDNQQLLQEQAAELRELNRSKDKFFSIIAHDLRGPISSITGLSGLLLQYQEKWSVKKVRETVETLKSTTTSLMNLLENLLQWSRIQSGAISSNPQKNDISKIVQNSIDIVRSSALQKNIKINCSVEQAKVMVDSTMLTSVIQNILTNAIKFSYKGGVIDITSSTEDEKVSLLITDYGLGIEEKVLKNILKIENQEVRLGTAGEKGTGLGLLLCNEFMRLNDGWVSIRSQVDQGTTITVSMPQVT